MDNQDFKIGIPMTGGAYFKTEVTESSAVEALKGIKDMVENGEAIYGVFNMPACSLRRAPMILNPAHVLGYVIDKSKSGAL